MAKKTENQKETLSDIKDSIQKLNNAFNDKIVELHDIKGGQTERHAFMYYRELLWSIKDKVKVLENPIILMLIIFLSSCTSYHNSISNPDNSEYVQEIAFNNNIKVNQVTQKQFNQRYK